MDSLHIHVRWGQVRTRLVVEAQNLIVLDGHHRLEVARRLGLLRVPVLLVDGRTVPVMRRGGGDPLTYDDVRQAALIGPLFPPRTTKHVLEGLDLDCRVDLDELRIAVGSP